MTLTEEIITIIAAAKETGLTVDQSEILKCAVKMHITKQISADKNGSKGDPNAATEKQIKFLKSLGFEGDTSKLTKREAMLAIKERTES